MHTRNPVPNHILRRAAPAVLLGAALALTAAAVSDTSPAAASVPTGAPTFSEPLEIDNSFFPVQPGAISLLRGKDGRERIHVVVLHLHATRTFMVGGQEVECRGVQETEFEDGELAEISINWFAQADDDTVYYFGETVDDYDDGEIDGHDGSWLVGGPAEGDPEGTMTVTDPAVFMPGNPEVGDEYRPEDLPDGNVEIATVRKVEKRVKVPFDRFDDAIEVRERYIPEDGEESKFYGPGVGLLMEKARGTRLKLEASTLQADD